MQRFSGPMGWRAAAAVAALLVAACASTGPPAARSSPCLRTELEPTPLWTAAAVWSADGEELLLVDPGSHRLLRFSAAGRLVDQVELAERLELDYSVPLRLQVLPNGYLLSGRHRLVWLDRSLAVTRVTRPADDLAPGAPEEVLLSDVEAVGGDLVAFADYERTADEWGRGFVRLKRRGALQPLLELPLDDDELTEYYHYDRRPFLARIKGTVYALRLRQPAQLLRLRRGRLAKVADLELADGYRAQSLHAAGGRLFLLAERLEPRAEEGEKPSAPALRSAGPADAAALLELSRAEVMRRRQWLVQEVDPKSGRLLGRYPLPTASMRLRLLPGPRHWALLEERLAPSLGEQGAEPAVNGGDGTRLLRLDARHFAPLRPGDERTVHCTPPTVLESDGDHP